MLFTFIIMPFVGALVRYRANYTPQTGRVHLAEEGLSAPQTTDSTSYFGMMKRVHHIEGWAGLYKGLMPSILESLFLVVFIAPISAILIYGVWPIHNGIDIWTISFLVSVVPVLLLIPMQIIINRAITTPYKLDFFDAQAALRVLLSPTERAQPLRLYLTPGVAPAILLEALVGPALSLLRLHTYHRRHYHFGHTLGANLPAIAVATLLLTPLQVMLARLTLQRLGPDAEETETPGSPPTYVNAEDVMDVRRAQAPYEGLVDCWRKIADEEGTHVLFRAWWLTPLVILFPVLAPMLAPLLL